jgi:probable F420-dependent oxidoreductase
LRLDRRIDVGELRGVPERARHLEALGFDGLWTAETQHDPFLPLLLAAEHVDLEIGTSIAVAFARNPMIVANLGWDLQAFSRGRFLLGLGTQVRPHITRRFGMPWSRPAARLREFVVALQAIWTAWDTGAPLAFEGEFYTHNLMTPYFNPGPNPFGPPKVLLGAVGERLAEVAGEVADGIVLHAFQTPRYVEEVLLPAIDRGLANSGRSRNDFQVKVPVFVVTGLTDEERAISDQAARKEIAFYGSTPAYRAVLEIHGWGDLQDALRDLSRRGEWDAMGRLITDEILETFAIVAKPPDVLAEVSKRYGDAVDRVGFNLPGADNDEVVTGIIGGRSARREP